MKILLVDDEVEFVRALAERMALRNIHVQWAGSPEEALVMVTKHCFDLAVLDVKMPGQSGWELKIRLQEKCPDMKYIFLTGHGLKEADQNFTNKTEEDNYLLKPIEVEDLIKKITAILF